MDAIILCRCCLMRRPDKDLKSTYTILGKTELYTEMLKECFEIHMSAGMYEGDSGICEICISRLRDACEFKEQVLRCQKEFQIKFVKGFVKDEALNVKLEISDADDNEEFIIADLKDELTDMDQVLDEDDQNLADMLHFQEVTIKKKNKNGKKSTISEDKSQAERKGVKLLNIPLKLSLSSAQKLQRRMKTVSSVSSESLKFVSNMNKLLKYSNCTPFSNKTLYGFVCAYCDNTCQDPEDLRTHTRTIHKKDELKILKRMDKYNLSMKIDITNLKCGLCEMNTDVISNLKKHLIKEHEISFYNEIKDYILEFKLTNSDVMNCALCNSKFETFKMLLQHMNGHYRNYICEVCDMGFINRHRLKSHARTHEVGNFNCSYCDKVFNTRVRKTCHEKYTHNTSARYTTNCPHCALSFTSYYQRNRHMLTEHNTLAASYKCNICDKSFILKSKLTSHIKKVHLMERNHICSECGQGFFIKQSLDEHMIRHNGERVHKCAVCNKAYARKKTLREHMRIHNNDRRFKCGMCGLAFVQKCSLKSHMLSNHGVTLVEFESAKLDLASPIST